MSKRYEVVLNPDLRTKTDPKLGELAPITTQFYYRIEVKTSSLAPKIGKGLFVSEDIRKGAVIVVGGGQLTSDLTKAPPDKDYAGVFDEKYYIAPLDYDSPSPNWFINHSCDPNTKVIGRLVIIARRDIKEGEELTVDYATVGAGDNLFVMECKCNSHKCRKTITNEDWKRKELFNEYFEEWPPFIQLRGIGFLESK